VPVFQSTRITHVVVPANSKRLAPRTLKYLSALLIGCWIVTFDCMYDMACCVIIQLTVCLLGIRQSVEAGRWLDPAPFEVYGDTIAGITRSPQASRLREAQRVSIAICMRILCILR
jgi:hypothetical protein